MEEIKVGEYVRLKQGYIGDVVVLKFDDIKDFIVGDESNVKD